MAVIAKRNRAPVDVSVTRRQEQGVGQRKCSGSSRWLVEHHAED